MPAMGESVTEGVILEWAKQPGDAVEADETIVEISTDKVDAEVPAPASGVMGEILAQPGETVTVGQVIGRMTAAGAAGDEAAGRQWSAGAAPRPGKPAEPAEPGEPKEVVLPDGVRLAGRPPRRRRRGHRPRASRAPARPAGSRRRTCSPPPRATARPRPPPPPPSATLIKGAAAMLARYMDESRSIPTATSFRTITVTVLDARRKELKDAGQKVSFTHLIAYAIAARATEQMPVMAHHFAEIDGKPHRVDDGAVNLGIAVDVEKKDGSRTLMVPVIRDAGRLSFAGFLAAFNDLIARARENKLTADDLVGRQHLAHQPRRHRHDRLGAAADGRPGHDRRHRLDRLPARPRRHRRR